MMLVDMTSHRRNWYKKGETGDRKKGPGTLELNLTSSAVEL